MHRDSLRGSPDRTIGREFLDRLAAHPAAAYSATKRGLTTLLPDLNLAEQFRSAAVHWTTPEIKNRLAEVLKK